MAESNSQEGWDANVDGEYVNFKSGLGAGHIKEHIERFPDISVITIAEQADVFGDDPNVTCLHDLSGEQIREATESTMNHAIESSDLHFDLPLITLILSSVRNIKPVLRGKSNIETAVKYTSADTVGVGFGGAAGAKLGGAIGIIGGPPGVAIGAILGGVIGVMGGKHLATTFKESDLRKAKALMDKNIAEYSKAYIKGLYQKANALDKTANDLRKKLSIMRYFTPTLGDVIRSDMRHAYRKWAKSCRVLAVSLQNSAKIIDEPDDFVSVGRGLLVNPPDESVYSKTIKSSLSAIRNANDEVKGEMERLGYSCS